jgi:hypothetical protein
MALPVIYSAFALLGAYGLIEGMRLRDPLMSGLGVMVIIVSTICVVTALNVPIGGA